MKNAITLLFTMVLGLVFASPVADEPYMVKKFDSKNIKNLQIQTSGGSIAVEGGHESEARVEVYVKGNSWNGGSLNKSEIDEKLKNYDLKVYMEGSKLICLAKNKKNDWKNGLSIAFKVYGPSNENIDVKTSGGSISLAKLNGNLDFGTSGGSISLKELNGDIEGNTSGGSINISKCGKKINVQTSGGSINASESMGEIELSTSGGSIVLEHLKGNIDASTSGGSVKISDVSGSIKTSTSGGSINAMNVDGNLDASTSGGGINATMLNVKSFLTLNTSAGSINVKMPLDAGYDLDIEANRVYHPSPKKFSGVAEKDELKGKWNGGGPKVTLTASSGNVNLK